jgi:hypothetical protein
MRGGVSEVLDRRSGHRRRGAAGVENRRAGDSPRLGGCARYGAGIGGQQIICAAQFAGAGLNAPRLRDGGIGLVGGVLRQARLHLSVREKGVFALRAETPAAHHGEHRQQHARERNQQRAPCTRRLGCVRL